MFTHYGSYRMVEPFDPPTQNTIYLLYLRGQIKGFNHSITTIMCEDGSSITTMFTHYGSYRMVEPFDPPTQNTIYLLYLRGQIKRLNHSITTIMCEDGSYRAVVG